MHVYQVIKNEYNSDDGHYDDDPLDDTVFRHEQQALLVRDELNIKSITAHNARVNKEIQRRTAAWETNGGKKGEIPAVNRHGTQYHDHLSSKGIKNYADKYTFMGDPIDVEAIEIFANRDRDITYYTVNTLVLR